MPGMSIITGRGDAGETDLLFGRRIAKTSLRIEALGCVDELNSALGVARAAAPHAGWIATIDSVQERLVGLMGLLATLPDDLQRYHDKQFAELNAEDVAWVEAEGHRYEAQGVRFTGWARPGADGSVARAHIDLARAVARRTERSILKLHESGEPVPEPVRLFFNRVADLLWILARVEEGGSEGRDAFSTRPRG